VSTRAVLLKSLGSTSGDLRRLVKGRSVAALAQRPQNGNWSAAECLSHLHDIEGRYLERLRRVASEENPFLPGIHPDESAHNALESADAILAGFESARRTTLEFLEALTPGDWQRPAVRKDGSPATMRSLVQLLAHHDIEHTEQIVKALAGD